MILPEASRTIAEASRSKSVPVVVRRSQPSPTVTADRPGACLVSETLPPLLRLTPTAFLPDRMTYRTPGRRLAISTQQRCYPFHPLWTHYARTPGLRETGHEDEGRRRCGDRATSGGAAGAVRLPTRRSRRVRRPPTPS